MLPANKRFLNFSLGTRNKVRDLRHHCEQKRNEVGDLMLQFKQGGSTLYLATRNKVCDVILHCEKTWNEACDSIVIKRNEIDGIDGRFNGIEMGGKVKTSAVIAQKSRNITVTS